MKEIKYPIPEIKPINDASGIHFLTLNKTVIEKIK
jgi:hypothetical protein